MKDSKFGGGIKKETNLTCLNSTKVSVSRSSPSDNSQGHLGNQLRRNQVNGLNMEALGGTHGLASDLGTMCDLLKVGQCGSEDDDT